jgi:hypothetical protein
MVHTDGLEERRPEPREAKVPTEEERGEAAPTKASRHKRYAG